MREIDAYFESLWRQCPDAMFFTSNGFISNNGRAVMGAGTAKAALTVASASSDILKMFRESQEYQRDKRAKNTAQDFVLWRMADLLRKNGNVTQLLLSDRIDENRWRSLGALPTKPAEIILTEDILQHVLPAYADRVRIGEKAPGWMMQADPILIMRSLDDMLRITDANSWRTVMLPMPGAGAGELPPSELALIYDYMVEYLDNRFTVFSRPDFSGAKRGKNRTR